jgi:hypothetical protein
MSRKLYEYAGIAASVVLIAIGVGAIVVGFSGRSTVNREVKREQIVGTPDMTPAAIKAEAAKAGLSNVALPTCSVAGQAIDNGNKARCFASYMRIHAMEATGGLTYAQMPRYATADGTGTNDAAEALVKDGRPVDNPARNLWINETALTTALNTSYFASNVALFSIVMGAALLLVGGGFLVMTVRLLMPADRRLQASKTAHRAVPAAG